MCHPLSLGDIGDELLEERQMNSVSSPIFHEDYTGLRVQPTFPVGCVSPSGARKVHLAHPRVTSLCV